MNVPFSSVFAAHQDDRKMQCEPSQFRAIARFGVLPSESQNPPADFALRLLHERPHRQAIDETTRPRAIYDFRFTIFDLRCDAIPKPGQNDRRGFAQAGRDVDQSRVTFAADLQRFWFVGARVRATRQPALVAIRRVARPRLEEFVESKSIHGSPPVLSAGAKCLVTGCIMFSGVAPRRTRTTFP